MVHQTFSLIGIHVWFDTATANSAALWPAINPNLSAYNNPRHFTSALKKGATGLGVATDLFGTTRVSPPTIGCYEYLPSPFDAGISAITSPSISTPVCGINTPIVVTLRNYGTGSITKDTIYWKVNGVAQTPYAWTGTLASGASQTGIVIGIIPLQLDQIII